jgi:hypothetical protein
MPYKNLTELSDFIHVLYNIRKHCANNEYFLMHIQFTTIYFVQPTKHDVHTYVKFGGLTFYVIL